MAYLSRTKEVLMEKLSEAEGLSQLDQQDTEQQQELLRKLANEKVLYFLCCCPPGRSHADVRMTSYVPEAYHFDVRATSNWYTVVTDS